MTYVRSHAGQLSTAPSCRLQHVISVQVSLARTSSGAAFCVRSFRLAVLADSLARPCLYRAGILGVANAAGAGAGPVGGWR